MIPIYIINRDLLTSTRNMASFLDEIPGVEVIIVDNQSTYPPLLEWYSSCPYKVYYCPENLGCRSVWLSGIYLDWTKSDWYVVTDSDLDLSGCPKDFVEHLKAAFTNRPSLRKCGLGLRLDDLPDHSLLKNDVRNFNEEPDRVVDGDYVWGTVDTTLALYNRALPVWGQWYDFRHSLRTKHPYLCRHLPWYYSKDNIPEDFYYYLSRADFNQTHWTKVLCDRLSPSS